jgi:hypothetical protein
MPRQRASQPRSHQGLHRVRQAEGRRAVRDAGRHRLGGDRDRRRPVADGHGRTELAKLACELPDDVARSLSTWTCGELARTLVRNGVVDAISASTVSASSPQSGSNDGAFITGSARRCRVMINSRRCPRPLRPVHARARTGRVRVVARRETSLRPRTRTGATPGAAGTRARQRRARVHSQGRAQPVCGRARSRVGGQTGDPAGDRPEIRRRKRANYWRCHPDLNWGMVVLQIFGVVTAFSSENGPRQLASRGL